MIRDEFNTVTVTNEKQVGKVEFGKTQKAEFSSHTDNKLPEIEHNDKVQAKSTSTSQSSLDTTNLIQQSTGTASSTAAETASGAVASTSSAAASASSIAAVSTSAVVAASVVAVTAISVATGISVALHNYEYKFNSFIVTSNEVMYDLSIFDMNNEDYEIDEYRDYESEEESEQLSFNLRVYNQSYDYSNELWLGSNYGTFEGLTQGQKYNIVLTENRFGGETLFEEQFTTKDFVESSTSEPIEPIDTFVFNSFEILPEANYLTSTISVRMNYVDEDDEMTDLMLELSEIGNESNVASVILEKTTAQQEVVVIDPNGKKYNLWNSYNYSFSYKRNDETVIFDSGTIEFTDNSGGQAVFKEFLVDEAADFKEQTFKVQLNYVDSYSWYSKFVITFTNDETSESVEVPLEERTDVQVISATKYHINLEEPYTYSLTCFYKGENTTLVSEQHVLFNDYLNRETRFINFNFDETMNFDNGEIVVRLEYVDTFEYFKQFELTFTNPELEDDIVVPLETKTEEQIFNNDFSYEIYPETTYTYTLTCLNNGSKETLDSGIVSFADSLGRESKFNELIFDGVYDIQTGDFNVTLDYQDDFSYYENFVLHLAYDEFPDYPIDIEFSEDFSQGDGLYTFNVNSLDIPTDYDFNYSLTARYKGNEETLTTGGPLHFNDPNAVSEVTGITFVNGEANFEERTFDVLVDYQDDYYYFSNFILTINDIDNGNSKEFPIDNPEETQTMYADEREEPVTSDSGYLIDIVAHDLTYNLSWTSWRNGEEETETLFEEAQPLSFENSLHHSFNGFESSFDFFTEEEGSYKIPFKLDYIDEANVYSNFTIDIQYNENSSVGAGQIDCVEGEPGHDWTYGYFHSYSSDDSLISEIIDVPSYLVVYAIVRDERTGETSEDPVEIYREQVTFTLDQNKQILGATVDENVTAGMYEMYLSTIAYDGRDSNYDDCQVILEFSDGTIYTYDFMLGENATIYLNSPNEGNFDEEEFEELASSGVKISIKYCTLSDNPEDPGNPDNMLKSDPITIVCYTDFVLIIQH